MLATVHSDSFSNTSVNNNHHHHLCQCYLGPLSRMESADSTSAYVSSSSSSSTASSSPRCPSLSNDSTSCVPSDVEMPSVVIGPHFDKLSRQQQELMKQWCTSTYRTFSSSSYGEHFWHTVAPRESLQHSYLRHGIFASSALHIASITCNAKTQRRYRKAACMHRDQAVTAFEQAIRKINTSNNTAVFAFGCIMVIFEFSSSLQRHLRGKDALEDFCKNLLFTREWIDAIKRGLASDTDGHLRPLLESREIQPKMPDMSRLAVMTLRKQNVALAATYPHHHQTDVYEETIMHLDGALESLSRGEDSMSPALRWICKVPARFIDMLEERRPFALVILAHYTVIMYNLREQWWMGEWGKSVLGEINRRLDPQWMQYMTWVFDATGFCT